MKPKSLILFVLAFCTAILQSCGDKSAKQSQTDNTTTPSVSTNSAPEAENSTPVSTSSSTYRFRFEKEITLPSEIKKVDDFCISHLYILIREDDMVYKLLASEPETIEQQFQLKDENGERLGGGSTGQYGQLGFHEKSENFVFLSERHNEVFYYDKDGTYKGKLQKPEYFEPKDLAFDNFMERGLYVLSAANPFGEIYLWEDFHKAPKLVAKGRANDLSFYAIESGNSSTERSFYAYSNDDAAIFHFREKDNEWKQTFKVGDAKNVKITGGRKIKTNFARLFVVGNFIFDKKVDHSSIRVYEIYNPYSPSDTQDDLLEYELVELPPGLENLESHKKLIREIEFPLTDVMYALIGNKLYKYKES